VARGLGSGKRKGVRVKVGFAEADVTPAVPCPIGGYGDHVAEEVLGPPLFVRSIAVIGEDGTEWALSAGDLIGYDREEICLPVIEALRSQGYAGGVVLTASHTHSGPHTRFSQTYMRERADDAYLERLRSALVSTILQGRRNARPAEVAVGRTRIRENVNRRVNLPDGTHHYLPHEKNLYPQATGPVDEELGVIAIRDARTRKPIATIVNYTAHALTIGNYKWVVSADYPGVLAQELSSLTGGPAMFTQGACGNVHPIGFEKGPERMKELGHSLAQAAYTVWRDLTYSAGAPVAYAEEDVELPTQEKFMTQEKFRWHPKYKGLKSRTGSVHAARLGDVILVGVPGELFVEIGLAIKKRSPAPYTYILYNTNAYLSYIPIPKAYEEGGYEPNATLSGPASAGIVEEAAVRVSERVWRAAGK
jgi:hypothetical protein